MKKLAYVLGIVLSLFMLACGASNSADDGDVNRLNDHANSNTDNNPVSKAPAQITEGDWEIGTKDNISGGVITPGTYVITSPDESAVGCLWSRVRDFDGDIIKSTITSGHIDAGATGRVTVKKSDAGLKLQYSCIAVKKK